MCVITHKPVEEKSEEGWEDVRAKRVQEVAKRQGHSDTAKEIQ